MNESRTKRRKDGGTEGITNERKKRQTEWMNKEKNERKTASGKEYRGKTKHMKKLIAKRQL